MRFTGIREISEISDSRKPPPTWNHRSVAYRLEAEVDTLGGTSRTLRHIRLIPRSVESTLLGITIGDIVVEDDDIGVLPGLLALANSDSYRLKKGAISRGKSSA